MHEDDPDDIQQSVDVPEQTLALDEEDLEDETQLVDEDAHGEPDAATGGDQDPSAIPKKRKEKAEVAREPGKSLLPVSRVLKIIKADEDMCLVQKEAQLLISLATEEFAKTFAQAMLATAERERRSTIAVRDIGIIGRSSDRFIFLQELLPELMVVRPAPPKRTGKAANKPDTAEHPTMTLNHFINSGVAAS